MKPGAEGSETLLYLEGRRAETPARGCQLQACLSPGCLAPPAGCPGSLGPAAVMVRPVWQFPAPTVTSLPFILPSPGLVLRPNTRELPRRPHHRPAQPLPLPGHRLPLQLQGVLRALPLPAWFPHEPTSQMRSLVRAEAQSASVGRREGAHDQLPAGLGCQPPSSLQATTQPLCRRLGPLPHLGGYAAILSKPMMTVHHSNPRSDPL